MSSWATINVAYSGEWEMPHLYLSRVWIGEHPNDGFDVLMYVFLRGEDSGAVKAYLEETAEEFGEIECAVTVSGSDTSDSFKFSLLEDGLVEKEWGNTHVDGWNVEYQSNDNVLTRIEDEIGRRPSFGGNYT